MKEFVAYYCENITKIIHLLIIYYVFRGYLYTQNNKDIN